MTSTLIIVGLVVLVWGAHTAWTRTSRNKIKHAQAILDDIAGLGDDLVPTSMHPQIDPDICIGSGSCVNACPEGDVLGIVGGRAKLVNPLGCVGHGACAAACPVDAITLVFGTARRGVELPVVDETFQTSQPGVYVVGELGGMGLIRNAITQGREAGEYIAQSDRRGQGEVLDAIVVGAGPAGIAATLQLMQEKLRVKVLEREDYGGTILHYPRAKVVMTGTLDIPRFGKVRKRTMRKEELVELWKRIYTETGMPIQSGELVEELRPDGAGNWVLRASSGEYRAANVVLALGRRGSPRKLEVPGEERAKVMYRLIEPEVFEGQNVMIVGGGNAAAECALALSDYGGCASVSLSYRRAEFARLRGQVRDRLTEAMASGSIRGMLSTEVVSIGQDDVVLMDAAGTPLQVDNDAVIVQIGGTPPTQLLSSFGIATTVKHGEA